MKFSYSSFNSQSGWFEHGPIIGGESGVEEEVRRAVGRGRGAPGCRFLLLLLLFPRSQVFQWGAVRPATAMLHSDSTLLLIYLRSTVCRIPTSPTRHAPRFPPFILFFNRFWLFQFKSNVHFRILWIHWITTCINDEKDLAGILYGTVYLFIYYLLPLFPAELLTSVCSIQASQVFDISILRSWNGSENEQIWACLTGMSIFCFMDKNIYWFVWHACHLMIMLVVLNACSCSRKRNCRELDILWLMEIPHHFFPRKPLGAILFPSSKLNISDLFNWTSNPSEQFVLACPHVWWLRHSKMFLRPICVRAIIKDV